MRKGSRQEGRNKKKKGNKNEKNTKWRREIKGNTVKKRNCEACPESKVTKVLNMYSIFNLQKRHCE
jgi:hypothetical protein